MRDAQFRVASVQDGVVFIVDELFYHPELRYLSITNDAENVVKRVLKDHPGKRIVYQDTDGNWDELVYDTRGNVRFAPWDGWHP
jgi:hypothetical protein